MRFKVFGVVALLMLATPVWAAEAINTAREVMQAVAKATTDQTLTAEDKLQRLIDLNYEYNILEFPEFATFMGDSRRQDSWTDNSLAAVQQRKQDVRSWLQALQSVERDALSDASRFNYDLMVQSQQDQIAGFAFANDYLVINQLSGPQQNVARMITTMRPQRVADYENIIARLNAVPQIIEQSMVLMRKGLAEGVTPPQITLRDVPQQVKNMLVEDPMQSPLLTAFAQFPAAIGPADQARLQQAAIAAYTDNIKPAFEKFEQFLSKEYIPGARTSIAMRELPNGSDWYAYNVQQSTTTELSPEQIHDIGLREVARIRAEMETVMESSGFEGSFSEFLEFLRTDEQFYFTDKEDLLRGYRDISKRADPELVKLFGKLPRLPYGVTPVPEYAEKSQTTAYYWPGSLAAGRPGQFFANTYDLKSRPKWEMEALTLHEAVPGHHFQIALAQELEDTPWFRKVPNYTAYIEGWGLYSESLGEEMGFYQNPYSKFGQLTYEMWRAIRLVVDTGMHQMGWSRERAIDFFKTNAGKKEHDIIVEVDRYIVWPGQALAYKIGELKIKELRRYAEQTLGDAFDIREFHDNVLGQGAIPLNLLEAHIRNWVDQVKNRT